MGMSLFNKCPTGGGVAPDPKRWQLMSVHCYPNAYVLVVRYVGVTNYEGVKILVYRGSFPGQDSLGDLDPHFSEREDSPIARFQPSKDGMALALRVAANI